MNKQREKHLPNSRQGTAAMSLADIGKLLGVSLQAIQGGEQRALRKIRKLIAEEATRAGCTPQEWLLGDD